VPEEKPSTPTTVTPPASPPVTAAVTPSKPAHRESAPREKIATKPRPSVASPKNVPVALAADTGDAEFRKAEALLYGRGVPQNCDEAVKYLKAASAKSNAKARSTFGTMYATGHCTPRDLPTSYLWFAMALRADPNNQILEKDLSAIWNQMTPPERQMATRMKQ
jgi:TPR repeat protein